MCVSIAKLRGVKFSNTTLYCAATHLPDGRRVHVLGYQNTVGDGQRRAGSPNAMLLPFPAVPRTMTKENVVDTSACVDVLEDYARLVRRPPEPPSKGPMYGAAPPPRVEVFDAGKLYTVVLASDARAIPEALARVPEHRRPAPNDELFELYARWYPDWTFALCCFDDGEAAARADPLVWWYEPRNPEQLFAPMLDGHDGKLPDLDARVQIDHTLVLGAHDSSVGKPANVDVPESLRHFFVRQVIGGEAYTQLENGDCVWALDEVRAGRARAQRVKPPGAQ